MLDLKIPEEQLNEYGPYNADTRRIALFTVANDFEAHGLPLPPHTDSLIAQNWCHRITRETGASYVAHIPYCTDSFGEIARNWSPTYIPFDEFYSKLRDFVKWHIDHLSFVPSKVAIIIGHGGNRDLPEREEDLGKVLKLPVRCMSASASEPLIYPEFEPIEACYEIIAKGGEHAYIVEYSLMAYYGHVDTGKLDTLNEVASKDPLEALKRWPAIAGLGGYTEYGGPEFDPLREVEGFIVAREDFKKRRKIVVDEELGRRLTKLIVSYFCEQLRQDS